MNHIDKKILIISHNPLSRVNNNGKTLASIFEGIPKGNIYQIYLNGDVPDFDERCHYLQLNEKQILRSVFGAKNICCQEIIATPDNISSSRIKIHSLGIQTKRLLREGIWKFSVWKPKLKKWLADKRFDVVFFMAGDGMFAYDIYRFVMENISAKGCMFFTDDYIIGKNSRSPIACLRRHMLRRKIKKTLPLVKDLYVISSEMKEAYHKLFGVNSYVIRNFSVEKNETLEGNRSESSSGGLIMVYAGGLHYNRWKVLSQIAIALKEINQMGKGQCHLKIYSSQSIPDKIVEKLNVDNASDFCGAAFASQIAGIYADADILLHVESFDKKAIASTRYSFSTKIPEYLSAGKCVLAVGPAEVASIQYLKNFACTVNESENLLVMLKKIISDMPYRERIQSDCEERYEKDFSRKKQEECLEHILFI